MRGRHTIALTLLALLVAPLGAPAGGADSDTDFPVDADWTEGPVSERHARLPDGLPYDEGRHFRVLLRTSVDASLHGAVDLPVTTTVDLAKALGDPANPVPYPQEASGQLKGFALEPDSFSLVEVDPGSGFSPVARDAVGQAEKVPLSVFEGGFDSLRTFDPRVNPEVTLRWVMDGPTHGDRFYFLYFDTQHNGDKAPLTYAAEDLGRIASSVGPGRGTRLFVPLHDDLGIADRNDPRTVRITNLIDVATSVDVYEYDRFGLRKPQPTATIDLPAGEGSSVLYRYDQANPNGALLLDTRGEGLIMAEASSRVTTSGYQPGTHRLFLPASTGGYVGTRFADTPAGNGIHWLVFCPQDSVPEGEEGCRVRVDGGAPTTILGNDFQDIAVPAGVTTVLDVEAGQVGVQRIPTAEPSRAQRSLSLWPPLDGPVVASTFMGHSQSEDGLERDRLLLIAPESQAAVSVKSMVGGRETLADELDLPNRGLFTEVESGSWGTSWDRAWRLKRDFKATPEHVDGPARILERTGTGLVVANGYATDAESAFSSLVPLQSSDGGLHYHFVVPSDAQGIPIGRLVMFAPYAGTDVVATGYDTEGKGTPRFRVLGSLRMNEYVGDLITEPGWWTLSSTRPVVLAWTRLGSTGYSAFAPAVTEVVDVSVEGAQASGYLFDVRTDDFKTVRPGTTVKFEVDVSNLATDVRGNAVPDTVQLRASTPPGWPTADVIPSTVPLDAGGSATAVVSVRVPATVDPASGGATVVLTASSVGEPRLEVETGLRISFKVQRGVHVAADGLSVEASKSVAEGENVTYIVEVTNTGSVADTFQVEYSAPGTDWDVQVLCMDGPRTGQPCLEDRRGKTPPLASQESMRYLFTVGPAEGKKAVRLVTQLLAISQTDPSIAGGVRMVTSIDTDRSFRVEVEDPTRLVAPGGSTVFRVRVHNDADVDEELQVDLLGNVPPEWNSPATHVLLEGLAAPVPLDALNGSVPIGPRSTVDLLVEQAVPQGEAPLVLALDRLTLRSTLSPTPLSKDVELRVITELTRGLQASAGAGTMSVLPGRQFDIGLTVTSLSNGMQTVRIVPEAPARSTGWSFADSNGTSAPWEVALPAHGTAQRLFQVQVPEDARPASAGPSSVVFQVSTAGYPTIPVPVDLHVAEQAAVEVSDPGIRVAPGRTTKVEVPVWNTGNVPLGLHASWTGGPEGWRVPAADFSLPPGQQWNGTFAFDVPAGTGPSEVQWTLRLHEGGPDGPILEETVLTVRLEAPALSARLTDVRSLPPDGGIYEVTIHNTGSDALRGVTATLYRGSDVQDQVTIDMMLPGSEHVANLIGPEDTRGLSLQVAAAHDPNAAAIDEGAFDALGRADRTSPGPGWALGLAAAAWAASRRRESP